MTIEQIYREESGRILATLIRLLGDFELAEEAVQEAFAAALEHWPTGGTPANPRAWLVSAGRNKAVDLLRRRACFEAKRDELTRLSTLAEEVAEAPEESMVNDDRLRLIFTCCHPALAREIQVPLTLRTLCGLSTEEIARAFLVPLPTMAQRLVRARQKIRDAGIPYRVPEDDELAERLDTVLLVVYLVFNEGYNATSGDVLIRRELSSEAIRLGRLLHALMPESAEAEALLALMLDDFELDSERSRDWSTALVQHAVAQCRANTELLNQWVKHWAPLAYRGMEGLVELFGQAPRPLQPQAVAAKVRAAHHALLTRCGLNTVEM